MESLWKNIGFKPANFTLDQDISGQENDQVLIDVPILDENRFPTSLVRKEPCNEDFNKCDGITVKNIPKNVGEKTIWEFLVDNGLPLDHSIENIRINLGEKNSWVIIDGLQPDEIKTIYESLHFPVVDKKFFEVPIYCKPLRLLTPRKEPDLSLANQVQAETSPSVLGSCDQQLQPNSVDQTKIEQNSKIIPGLTKSQKKKAAKKAKEREKQQNNSAFLKSNPKQAELSCTDDNESEFEFNDLDNPTLTSKFFRKNDSKNHKETQSRLPGKSDIDRVAQKEEFWERHMQQRKSKRMRDSPENENNRKGSKKPSLI